MKVFFMHIPKTAGTSFRFFLQTAFELEGRKVLPVSPLYSDCDEFLRQGKDLSREYDLLYGHYPYHVMEVLPRDTRVVTVLRSPLERCVSHIKHQIRMETERLGSHELVLDVNAYIEDSDPGRSAFVRTLRNILVKFLSFGGHPYAMIRNEDLSLELALDRCRKSVVGFADDLGSFQARLRAEMFGKADVAIPERIVNTSEDTFCIDELTPANRKLLEELNQLDVELYREVKKAEGQSSLT